MASIEEVQAEYVTLQASWHDLRPLLVRYLPHDMTRLSRADRLLVKVEQYLKRATKAETQGQKLRAQWWYSLSLAAVRDHSKLMDELVERGLQAQERAKRLDKVLP